MLNIYHGGTLLHVCHTYIHLYVNMYELYGNSLFNIYKSVHSCTFWTEHHFYIGAYSPNTFSLFTQAHANKAING